jgi:YidC/Oxa1 family membrane protein insertase
LNETPPDANKALGQKFEFDVKLIEQPLDVVRNTNRYPSEQVDGNEERASLLTTIASIDGLKIREGKRFIDGLDALLNRNWEAKPTADGNGIDFELPLRAFLAAAGVEADLTLVKSYHLKPFEASKPLANYDIEYSTTIRNNDDKAHEISIRQEGLSGLTLEGWWYSVKQNTGFSAAGARDVIVGRQGSSHELISRSTIEATAKNNPLLKEVPIVGQGDAAETRNLRYFGIDSQYFVAALLPPNNTKNGLNDISGAAAFPLAVLEGQNQIPAYKDIAMNVSFYLDSPVAEVTKDKPLIANYRIFAGPKEPPILDAYGLSDTVYYGWSIFGMVAKPLSFILHAFYALVRNYGIAIMMLTVLVRSCMFPLSWRASIMGQKMQELAPELKKINELYKDDMQKRGLETQKLYKKYNLNPMASCLPMFIQLPIFIGLYRAVSTDVALRQQPLVPGWDWCSNLAGPDQFMLWPTWMPEYFAGKGTGWFGPYINLLPIITCLLFIVQQKVLMPKATDEQARMTQNIMMFMTVFMGIMFFKVPAGLCIYFITSSTWSLVERFLVKKFLPKAQLVAATVSDTPELPKPKPERRLQNMASAKPPEKLADLWPWLKGQLKRPEPGGGSQSGNSGGSSGGSSGRTNGPRRKK